MVTTVNRVLIDRGRLPRSKAHGQKNTDRGYHLPSARAGP